MEEVRLGGQRSGDGRSEACLHMWTEQELKAKPPVSEEEKISKRIHVMRESGSLTWFFRGKGLYHKPRQRAGEN